MVIFAGRLGMLSLLWNCDLKWQSRSRVGRDRYTSVMLCCDHQLKREGESCWCHPWSIPYWVLDEQSGFLILKCQMKPNQINYIVKAFSSTSLETVNSSLPKFSYVLTLHESDSWEVTAKCLMLFMVIKKNA